MISFFSAFELCMFKRMDQVQKAEEEMWKARERERYVEMCEMQEKEEDMYI